MILFKNLFFSFFLVAVGRFDSVCQNLAHGGTGDFNNNAVCNFGLQFICVGRCTDNFGKNTAAGNNGISMFDSRELGFMFFNAFLLRANE